MRRRLPLDVERRGERLDADDQRMLCRDHDDDEQHHDDHHEHDKHHDRIAGPVRPSAVHHDDDADPRDDHDHQHHEHDDGGPVRLLLPHVVSLGGWGLHRYRLRARRADRHAGLHDHDLDDLDHDADPVRLRDDDYEHHHRPARLLDRLHLGRRARQRVAVAMAPRLERLQSRLPLPTTDGQPVLRHRDHAMRHNLNASAATAARLHRRLRLLVAAEHQPVAPQRAKLQHELSRLRMRPAILPGRPVLAGDRAVRGPDDDDDHEHHDHAAALLAVLHHDNDDHDDYRRAEPLRDAIVLVAVERQRLSPARQRMPAGVPVPAADRYRPRCGLPAVADALRRHHDDDDDNDDHHHEHHVDDLDDLDDDLLPDGLSDVHLPWHVLRADRLPGLLRRPVR